MEETAPLKQVPRPVGTLILAKKDWFLDMLVKIAGECADLERLLVEHREPSRETLCLIESYVMSICGLGGSLRGYYEKLLRKEARIRSEEHHAEKDMVP